MGEQANHMRSIPPSLPFVFVLAIALQAAPAARAVTFADGQVHVIDATNSFPFEDVDVEDGAGVATTTVELVDGGEVGTQVSGSLRAFEHSVVLVSGGEVGGGVSAQGNSTVNISGGLIERVSTENFAHLTISGGTIPGGVRFQGTPTVEITGGVMGSFLAESTSIVTMSGGTIQNTLDAVFDASVTFSGGEIQGNVESRLGADVTVSGGLIGGSLFSLNDSLLTIIGSGFNFPLGDISATSGTLTDTLADGTLLNASFGRASTATITLVQSEPTPSVRATKEDLLLTDIDGDGRADPGDTLRYEVSIPNAGTADAENVSLADLPDANSSLVVGSVTITSGTVIAGNSPGDISVQVDVGTLAAGGGSAAIPLCQ